MALRRVLALLLAVGMIFGAWQLRGAREQQARQATGEGALTLTCAAPLMEVCRALSEQLRGDGHDLASEPAPALAGTGVSGGTGPPAGTGVSGSTPAGGVLLTLAPLQELAGAPADAQMLARSPLVVAMHDERAEVLTEHCGGALSWRCVGDAVELGRWADIGGEATWGTLKPAHPDPADSEVGLLALGQIATGFFGSSDLGSRQIDDVEFFAWFARFQDAIPALPGVGDPLQVMAAQGASGMDVLAVVEAQAVDLLVRSAARAPNLRLHPIEPAASADVVAAAVGQDEGVQDLITAVGERAPALLAGAGWRVEGMAASPALEQAGVDLGALPGGNGLPPAGTLEALRRLHEEL